MWECLWCVLVFQPWPGSILCDSGRACCHKRHWLRLQWSLLLVLHSICPCWFTNFPYLENSSVGWLSGMEKIGCKIELSTACNLIAWSQAFIFLAPLPSQSNVNYVRLSIRTILLLLNHWIIKWMNPLWFLELWWLWKVMLHGTDLWLCCWRHQYRIISFISKHSESYFQQ